MSIDSKVTFCWQNARSLIHKRVIETLFTLTKLTRTCTRLHHYVWGLNCWQSNGVVENGWFVSTAHEQVWKLCGESPTNSSTNYVRLNEKHDEVGQEDYKFLSYQMEEVSCVQEFYTNHLAKIASRMDTFHQNGSRLILQHIKHIHIT